MGLFLPLDVSWPDNFKVMRVGLAGAGLHAMAMCIAKRTETDGIVHRSQLLRLGADDDLVDALIDEGLLDVVEYGTRAGEDPDRGYLLRIHDWHDRNPSQDAIASTRASKAAAAQRGNHARWRHPGAVSECRICNPNLAQPDAQPDAQVPAQSAQSAQPAQCVAQPVAQPHASQTPSMIASSQDAIAFRSHIRSPETETETETETEKTDAQSDAFATFWAAYPRKVDRKRAASAWRRLSKADQAAALDALPTQRSAWRDPKFIPHPTTWLNGRRWEDEITPAGDNRSTPTRDVGGVRLSGTAALA